MLRKTGLIFLGALLVGVPSAWAQRVEVSFKGGYTASEGVTGANGVLGAGYNALDVESGAAFHFTFGVFLTEQVQAEFLWGQQSSKLKASGVATTDIADMTINNYMFNIVQNWGASDSKVRPYVFGGLGATNYSFGDLIGTPPIVNPTGNQIESRTRFSSNWGGGVKFYFSPNFGASFGLRWTPTYIKSDPAGVWCDPWYGCWQLVNNQYSHQFETAGGLTFRF